MKHKYFRISIFIVLIFLTFISCFSQNIVPNGSFELMKSGHEDKPDFHSQVEYLQKWENFESSDVFGPNYPAFFGPNQQIVSPQDGLRFLGFGPCEGAQVKLTESIPEMSWVTISFWFMPRNSLDTEINAYIMSGEADANTALNNCNSPNIEYEVNFIAPVNGSNEHPPGEWHYFSQTLLVEKSNYSWLAIKGKHTQGHLSHANYVLIDNVSVIYYEFCSHICVSTDVPVFNYITQDTEGVVGNSGANFLALIEGANSVEMLIWNQWGQLAFYYESFDPNGLKDPGYDDFAIVWNGHSTLTGGDFIPEQVYPFRVTAISCNGTELEHNGIINFSHIISPPAVVHPESKNKKVDDCCEDFKYIQNTEYFNNHIEAVNDFIIAGNSVTNPPFGDVVVKSGSSVNYRAGNQIVIEPGFIIENNAVFTATIEPCGFTGKSSSLGFPDESNGYYDSIRIRKDIQTKKSFEVISIYPNPNTGEFSFTNLKEDLKELIILDNNGRSIFHEKNFKKNSIVDLKNHEKGIYFAELHFLNNNKRTIKFILN